MVVTTLVASAHVWQVSSSPTLKATSHSTALSKVTIDLSYPFTSLSKPGVLGLSLFDPSLPQSGVFAVKRANLLFQARCICC